MNKVVFEITNCCCCPYHYVEPIYTPDPWEHEEAVYCSKTIDEETDTGNKIVCADGWNLDKYADIPDWCPLLKK